MKTITIKVSDKQYSLLTRIAAAEKRRLSDFNYLLYGQGLDMFFCERSVDIPKEDDEYTKKELAQIKKNNAIINSGKTSTHAEREEAGFEFVSKTLYNYDDREDGEKDFVTKLANEIEELAYKEPCMESKSKPS